MQGLTIELQAAGLPPSCSLLLVPQDWDVHIARNAAAGSTAGGGNSDKGDWAALRQDSFVAQNRFRYATRSAPGHASIDGVRLCGGGAGAVRPCISATASQQRRARCPAVNRAAAGIQQYCAL